MSRNEALPVIIDDDTTIYVEANMLGGEENVSVKSFVFDQVADAVTAVSKRFSSLFESVEADKATVEFGVEVAVESGKLTALFVNGKGTATFNVALEWNSKDNGE